jgi:hypothetical protein
MAVALDHLEVVDDLALVPDVVARGDDVNIQFEQFLGERGRDTKAGGGIFTVGDDQVDPVLTHDSRQSLFDNGASGAPKNVADEENSHETSRKIDGTTRGLPVSCGGPSGSAWQFGQVGASQYSAPSIEHIDVSPAPGDMCGGFREIERHCRSGRRAAGQLAQLAIGRCLRFRK